MADESSGRTDTESGTPEVAVPRKAQRRRASRAAGPTGGAVTAVTATAAVEQPPTAPAARPTLSFGPPPRRRPNRGAVALAGGIGALVVIAVLSVLVVILTGQQRAADALATRDQQLVDTATQTVVNMFTYTPDTVDESVNRFVDGISGPLRDMMSQTNNVENLKALFRDTNASSEAVVSGAALEEVDQDTDNGSVLVSVRVTVTDIDGVNKPSQAYRMRVIVHEDDNGRMTGYDLKYPDGETDAAKDRMAFGLVSAIVVAGIVALAAISGGLYWDRIQTKAQQTTRAELRPLAQVQIPQVFGYDYQTVEGSLTDAYNLLTPEYRREFESRATEQIIPEARERQVISQASVVGVGVLDAQRDSGSVMVYMNRTVTDKSKEPVYDGSRLKVDYQKVDGKWLISYITPI